MIGLTRFFADHEVLARVNNFGICFPKIAIGAAPAVFFRNPLPKDATTCFAPITDEIRYDLSGSSAKRYPNPSFEGFAIHI